MTKRRFLIPVVAILLIVYAAIVRGYRTQWSRELLSTLDNAEAVTGEAVWLLHDERPLSPKQVESVLDMIRRAKLADNRGFAGTTPEFEIVLTVDGERAILNFIEIQYHSEGENRSVSMRLPQDDKEALRQLWEESFPEAGNVQIY